MVRPRPSSLALRLLLAACALLAGLDLHVLELGAGPARAAEVAEGGVQVHDNDCQHREHVPPHHDAHECTLCKTGAARTTGVLPQAVAHARPLDLVTQLTPAAPAPRAPLAAGNLGARGPPGTDA